MPQIQRPGFEGFWRGAHSLAELHERIAEAMRVEIAQTRPFKSLAEYLAHGGGTGSVIVPQANRRLSPGLAKSKLGCGKERVALTPV